MVVEWGGGRVEVMRLGREWYVPSIALLLCLNSRLLVASDVPRYAEDAVGATTPVQMKVEV